MLRSQLPSANALFTFECVARLGSFTAAARELNVTQPAVSRSISALERHLGYELFIRHGRWIRLTPRGETLYRSSNNAFSSISQTLMRLDSRNRKRSTVSLSMSTAMANHWLVPNLGRFQDQHPAIDLQLYLHSGDQTQVLQHCDLSIGLTSPDDAGNHSHPYADEKVFAVCSPEYLKRHGQIGNQRRFRGHTFIQFADYPLNWDRFFDSCGIRFFGPEKSLMFTDYSTVIEAALAGRGIALGWSAVISKLLLGRKLVLASRHVIRTGRRYDIVTHVSAPVRPALEDVRNWFISQMKSDLDDLEFELKLF